MTQYSVYMIWLIIDIVSFLLTGLSKSMIPIYLLFIISGVGINMMLITNTLKKIERQKWIRKDITISKSDSYSPLIIKHKIDPFSIDVDRLHIVERISVYINLIHVVTMTIIWVISWSYSKIFIIPWSLTAYIIYYETYKCDDNDSFLTKLSNIIPEKIIQFITCNRNIKKLT
jgi:hypothetical protein